METSPSGFPEFPAGSDMPATMPGLEFEPLPAPPPVGTPFLSPLNMKLGLMTPMHRLVFWSTSTAAVLWLARPKFMFKETGEPKAWSILRSGVAVSERRDADLTPVPWYAAALTFGFLMAHLA